MVFMIMIHMIQDFFLRKAPRSAKALIYTFLGVFMTLKVDRGTPPALSIFSDLKAENNVFWVSYGMHSCVERHKMTQVNFRDSQIALSFQVKHGKTQKATATPVSTPNFPNSSFITSCRDDPQTIPMMPVVCPWYARQQDVHPRPNVLESTSRRDL